MPSGIQAASSGGVQYGHKSSQRGSQMMQAFAGQRQLLFEVIEIYQHRPNTELYFSRKLWLLPQQLPFEIANFYCHDIAAAKHKVIYNHVSPPFLNIFCWLGSCRWQHKFMQQQKGETAGSRRGKRYQYHCWNDVEIHSANWLITW